MRQERKPNSMSSRLILTILLVHLISTAAMFGVIWQVQLITYPQFASVESVSFPQFHHQYCQRITWIVGPLMTLELVSSAASVLALWHSQGRSWPVVSLALVIAMWGVTALVQVPQHEVLSFGFDSEVADALVSGNWLRVIGWTAHLAVISFIFFSSRAGTLLSTCREELPSV